MQVGDPTSRVVGLSAFFPTAHLTNRTYMDATNILASGI